MASALNSAARPASHSIVITQGDSFELELQLVDDSGDAIALTGLQGLAQVRTDRLPNGTLIATLDVDVDQAVLGEPTAGRIIVSATGSATDQVISGVWELEINDGTASFNFRRTVLFGSFSTIPQTTE